jgi:hypothetical protein
MLPGSSLHRILVGLCSYPTDVVKEDCQLSVEYLLTIYHPPNLQSMVPTFETAGFHRVLKSVYRSSQQYAKLLEIYLVDSADEEAVFGCISDILRPTKGLAQKQINEVKQVIVGRATDLVAVEAEQTAITLKFYAPDLLEAVLNAIEDDHDAQYRYLKALIEPEQTQSGGVTTIDETLPPGFVERYVQLMCTYNSSHVADFVSLLKSGDLRLDPVLPALEKSGVIDAAVVLLARDGLVKDAMDRLVKHLGTLETALTGLIGAAGETPDVANAEEAAHDLLEDIQKYVKVGMWLCQGQTRSAEHPSQSFVDRRKSAYGEVREEDLALDELLWLDLIDTVVKLIKETSTAIGDMDLTATSSPSEQLDTTKITTTLRSSVQQAFSALLASTTVPPTKSSIQPSASSRPPLRHTASQSRSSNPSFLRILRCFLTRATRSYSPSLTHLRSVLAEIFAAYTFEETILQLANSFLDKEGFANVQEISVRRTRGWRPRGQVCEGCKGRCWGPGAGVGVWDAWEKREVEREAKKKEEEDARWYAERRGSHKGKGKSRSASQSGDEDEGEEVQGKGKGPLVVFACRHMWHKTCVESAISGGEPEDGGRGRLRCPLCVE